MIVAVIGEKGGTGKTTFAGGRGPNTANRRPCYRTVSTQRNGRQTCSTVSLERTSIRRAVPSGRLIDEWRLKDPKGRGELAQIYTLGFDESPPIQN